MLECITLYVCFSAKCSFSTELNLFETLNNSARIVPSLIQQNPCLMTHGQAPTEPGPCHDGKELALNCTIGPNLSPLQLSAHLLRIKLKFNLKMNINLWDRGGGGSWIHWRGEGGLVKDIKEEGRRGTVAQMQDST